MGLISAYNKLKEYLRIYRYRAEEELNRHHIFFELFGRRWKSILFLSILILTTFTLDIFFTSWAMPRIVNQHWYVAISAYLQFPSTEVVTNLLSAIISGVAAVIGILLAISLVVLQLSADRYPHGMVRFLLEEKVGAYLIDFLITTLLFSMWTLFLLHRGPTLPFVSIVVALSLDTLSIVFVFVYREYSLYFFRPKQGFEAVAREAKNSLITIFKKGRKLGISVTTHLQKRVEESVQVIAEFVKVLSEKKDPDLLYGNIVLSSILSLYVTEKRFIDIQSGWFPTIEVPASSESNIVATQLSQPFEELALGERAVLETDTDWLERQIMSSLRDSRNKAIEKQDIRCIVSLMHGYKGTIESCFDQQEFDILDLTLVELQDFATQILATECAETANEFYNVMLLLAENAIKGMDLTRVKNVLAELSWYSDNEIVKYRLPKVFSEELLAYRKKIETEIILENTILTPRRCIEKEIIEKLSSIDQAFSKKYYGEEFKGLEKIFTVAVSKMSHNGIRNVLLVELRSLRRAIVLNKNNLAMENINSAMNQVLNGYEILGGKKALRKDIFKELKLGCFNSIKCRDATNFSKFYETIVQVSLKEIETGDSFVEDALKSVMVIASLVFLHSEFYQDKTFDIVLDTLSRHYDLSKLINVFDAFLIGYNPNLTLEYHHWFKDIFLQMVNLPIITKKRPPARGLDVIYDHPSEFIQRSSQMMGIKECAKGMIERLKERIRPE